MEKTHQTEGLPGFHSGLKNYFDRINKRFDPIIVQSAEEWDYMVHNLAFEYSLIVKTVILPPGVGLTDPRLENARLRSAKTYMREPGTFFEYPATTYLGHVDGDLVPPAEGCVAGEETRYQIIPHEKIPASIQLATESEIQSKHTIQRLEERREERKPLDTVTGPVSRAILSFFGRKPPADLDWETVPGSERAMLYAPTSQ